MFDRFLGWFVVFVMVAGTLLFIFTPERECADTRPWSVGNSALGASGTWCARWK